VCVCVCVCVCLAIKWYFRLTISDLLRLTEDEFSVQLCWVFKPFQLHWCTIMVKMELFLGLRIIHKEVYTIFLNSLLAS